MKHYLTDRGVQAAISSGIIIAAAATITDGFRPAYVVLGVAWVAVAAAALVFARRKKVA